MSVDLERLAFLDGYVSSLARGTSCDPPEMFARRLIIKKDGSRECWKVPCYSSRHHGWVASMGNLKLGMRMMVVKDDDWIEPCLSQRMRTWKPEQVNV